MLSRTALVAIVAVAPPAGRTVDTSTPYLDRLFAPSAGPLHSIEGTDVGGPGDYPYPGPEDYAAAACFPPDDWDPNAPEPNSTEPD